MKETTVSINGTVYDSRTGNPLRKERGYDDPTRHRAQNIHTTLQKSTTLNRRYVHHETSPMAHAHTVFIPQRQHVEAPSANSLHRRAVAPRTTHSQAVAHFAKQTPVKPTVIHDIGPTDNKMVTHANNKVKASRPQANIYKPSQVIKNEAIQKALNATKTKDNRQHRVKTKKTNKFTKFLSVASASFAVLVLGAYFTYLNMPALSTRVAAAQAGINASYPGYTPTGYSLNGPVAYQEGQVSMKFATNAGPRSYSLSQTHSTWDSSALLENYVVPQAGDNYVTTNSGGLTIYSYNTTSSWVNNGILYTIHGNSMLSDEQIQRIASSL